MSIQGCSCLTIQSQWHVLKVQKLLRCHVGLSWPPTATGVAALWTAYSINVRKSPSWRTCHACRGEDIQQCDFIAAELRRRKGKKYKKWHKKHKAQQEIKADYWRCSIQSLKRKTVLSLNSQSAQGWLLPRACFQRWVNKLWLSPCN